MYEERRIKFDWLGFIIKIIILIIFLFVLFKVLPIGKVNNIAEQTYTNNVSTMKDAAKSYYTKDKLPQIVGESKKMTLQDMVNDKMIIEFTDKDGNKCDGISSYVEITKVKYDEYVLKTQLVCGQQVDYVLETIGCYDICSDCKVEPEIEYEFKKAVKTATQVKGCKTGYTLSGNTCYKTIKTNYTSATAVYNDDTISKVKAKISDSTKTEIKYCANSNYSLSSDKKTCSYTDIKSKDCTSSSNWKLVGRTYNCTNSNTTKCEYLGTELVEACGYSPCYIYVSKNVYNKYTLETKTTCKCPSGYSERSDGKCQKVVTVASLTKTITTPGKEYCEDLSATLKSDGYCYKTISGTFKEYKCPDNTYILSGATCYKKSTETASVITVNKYKTTYDYTWNKNSKLSGWTRTGKTRDINTEENYTKLLSEIKTSSDEEINAKLITPETNHTSVGIIILYILVGLGIIYLLFMIFSLRKKNA